MINVKPVEGYRVRYPDGSIMPPEGGEIDERDPYWHRRIEDGDVLIDTPPPATKGAK
jgi:hypothetical protein